MALYPEYFSPTGTTYSETEIKKSKFITAICGVTSKKEAELFFQKRRDQHPGASHNCFAYIIGNPKNPDDIGISDAGEPFGTAGKPMLNVLQHSKIGNVAVMVTRFFGGVKLGTGGLVRAYSNAVKKAVEQSSLHKIVQSKRMNVSFPYQFENTVRHILTAFELTIVDTTYSDEVSLEIEIPEVALASFLNRINDVTKGGVIFNEM